jgi:hypothetical protein
MSPAYDMGVKRHVDLDCSLRLEDAGTFPAGLGRGIRVAREKASRYVPMIADNGQHLDAPG